MCVLSSQGASFTSSKSAEHELLCKIHFCSCSQQQAGPSWHGFTLSAVIILDLANKPGECNQPWASSVSCPAGLKCQCGRQASQLTHAECVTGGKVLIACVKGALKCNFFFWFDLGSSRSFHSSLIAPRCLFFIEELKGSSAAMSTLLRCICSSSDILFQRGVCRKIPGRRNFRTFSALWDEKVSKGRKYTSLF